MSEVETSSSRLRRGAKDRHSYVGVSQARPRTSPSQPSRSPGPMGPGGMKNSALFEDDPGIMSEAETSSTRKRGPAHSGGHSSSLGTASLPRGGHLMMQPPHPQHSSMLMMILASCLKQRLHQQDANPSPRRFFLWWGQPPRPWRDPWVWCSWCTEARPRELCCPMRSQWWTLSRHCLSDHLVEPSPWSTSTLPGWRSTSTTAPRTSSMSWRTSRKYETELFWNCLRQMDLGEDPQVLTLLKSNENVYSWCLLFRSGCSRTASLYSNSLRD